MSDFKIDKNVKNVEIDHIGAYLCGHKLSELLLCHYNDEIGRENCEILCFKVSSKKWLQSDGKKWHLFCFVFGRTLEWLKNVHSHFRVHADLWIDKKRQQ